ncbi:MAG: hypothetical protein AB7F43_11240 [Bacteriovoracia bacterium]
MPSYLLVIDVQNGFINKHTKHVPALVEKAQSRYDFLIATQFYNPSNSFFRTCIEWDKVQRTSDEFLLAFTPRKDAFTGCSITCSLLELRYTVPFKNARAYTH